MAEVVLSGLTKSFGATRALVDVSMTIPDGAFVVLLGPTGAGKTTTLRLIAGLDKPDAGDIGIAGHSVDFHHFVHHDDRVGEGFEPFPAVVAGFDSNEDIEPEPDRLRIGERHHGADYPGLLHLLNAPPAGRWRKADKFGNRRRGSIGVLLQQGEDPSVGLVHGVSITQTAKKLQVPR